MLTNTPYGFQNYFLMESGLSGFHKIIASVIKTIFKTNASHRYPTGRDHIMYKFTVSTTENLRHIFRSYKIRSTYYTEITLHKLLCKPNNRVATEDKNNIVYEIDCENCEVVSFGESERSLKLLSGSAVVKKIKLRNAVGKHITSLAGIRKVVDRESRLIPRNIIEIIHSLKKPYHINKISYMCPETWLPNLW